MIFIIFESNSKFSNSHESINSFINQQRGFRWPTIRTYPALCGVSAVSPLCGHFFASEAKGFKRVKELTATIFQQLLNLILFSIPAFFASQ
jgi:hypothetical protein